MATFNNDALTMPPPLAAATQRPFRPADAVSVVSDSSVFCGAMDSISTALRGLRKALRLSRNDYVAAMKEYDTLSEDDKLDFRQDLDGARKMVWTAAWRLVKQTRVYADSEVGSNQDRSASLLSITESSLSEIRKLWNATYYFDKNSFASHLFLPTYEDVHNEPPESGAKRALEMTTASSLPSERPLSRRRTSTPNVTDDNEKDDLELGADAENLRSEEEQRNAPRHVAGALADAEQIRVNLEPATPGTTARSHFLSARR